MTIALLDRPVHDDATRRQFLIGGASLAGLLAGCGGTATPPVATGAGSDPFPVVIEHQFGSTTITRMPERVVVVGVNEQDALLALGVVPVATTGYRDDPPPGMIYPWATDKLGGGPIPEIIPTADPFNFEGVAAQRPDLIVGLYSGMTQSDYDIFSKIAPTLAHPEEYPDFGMPWQEITRTIGRALGKPNEAEKLVADVEKIFAKARDEHPEFKGQSFLTAVEYEGVYLHGPKDTRARVFKDLGFVSPEGLGEIAGDSFGGSLSTERIVYLDTKVLVWFNNLEELTAIRHNPLFDKLAVMSEGREIFAGGQGPFDIALTGYITVLSLPFLLNGLIPRLVAALDGDPATKTDVP